MTVWQELKNEECYAVALYNFHSKSPHHLALDVGELVHLKGESKDWYWGISTRRDAKGAFPKNYVKLRENTENEASDSSTCGTELLQYITVTLRDWLQHMKKLYLVNDDRYKIMTKNMYILMKLRTEIALGAMSQDELKRFCTSTCFTIDNGNRILGLELVIRGACGRPVNPLTMSAYQLNNLHVETDSMFNNNRRFASPASKPSPAIQTYTVLGKVTNFVSRLRDYSELILSLYDATGAKLTESVLLHWAPHYVSAAAICKMPTFVFTNLSRVTIKRMFLVCHVVRLGAMDVQCVDRRRTFVDLPAAQPPTCEIRNPYGVACAEISLTAGHDRKEIQLPFFVCEKETMDMLLKKIISTEPRDHKQLHGLWVSIQMVKGDINQIEDENLHLMMGPTAVARTMTIPEVFMPNYVRNDLYVTLVGGVFSRREKSSERNIEVIAKVFNKNGKVIKGSISRGAGKPLADEYRSVVYYHNDRPMWQEVFKVCLSIEDFREAHVVFFIYHRSSNVSKYQSKRHSTIAYLPLMQKKGIAVPDSDHTLAIYQIDGVYASYSCAHVEQIQTLASTECLKVKSRKDEVPPTQRKQGSLLLIPRDSLNISTKLCSTKLTQSEEIMDVLQWSTENREQQRRKALQCLLPVSSDELVKFLQDILNALFSIWTKIEAEDHINNESYAVLVFDCLLRVLSLMTDSKYQHFQPVLDVYIEEDFCDALVFEKIIQLMTWTVQSLGKDDFAKNRLLQCLKCLQHLMHLIVRSKQLRVTLEVNHCLSYCPELQGFLEEIICLMEKDEKALACQGAVIKYLPRAIPHMTKIYPPNLLSDYTIRALQKLSLDKLPCRRLQALQILVSGPLGASISARRRLLPYIATVVCHLLQKRAELRLCVELLGEVMSLLARNDVGSIIGDRDKFTQSVLPTVLRTVKNIINEENRDENLLRKLICIVIDTMRNLTEEQYIRDYINSSEYSGNSELLFDTFSMITALLQQPVFPPHFADMLHLQYHIILHSLSLVVLKLRELLKSAMESNLEAMVFVQRLFLQWFSTLKVLAVSAPLQLETLRSSRRKRVEELYGDTRKKAAILMADTWFNLGTNKGLFIPQLIETFLEVSFIRNEEIRRTIIPLFFDMMQTEYALTAVTGKANIRSIETDLIDKLEVAMEAGLGDEDWGKSLVQLCGSKCVEASPELKEAASALVAALARQLNTLLQYRAAPVHQRVYLVMRMLTFYENIDRPNMYIRYVHRLVALHKNDVHWAEAGLALTLHANLLEWINLPLPIVLRHPNQTFFETHLQLKSYLYKEAASYLERDSQWELAAQLLQELVSQEMRDRSSNNEALATLYEHLATLYRAPLTEIRMHSTFFRVRYMGRGFPDYLRETWGFVYRGNACEMLQTFKERMLDEWPCAQVLLKLDDPSEDIINSDGQYLQINAVTPRMAQKWQHLLEFDADTEVVRYYEYNNVKTFEYSRPFYRYGDSPSEDKGPSEFAAMWLECTVITISHTLPGILRCFPVVSSKTYSLCPLEVAVQSMAKNNKELKNAILDVKGPGDSLKPLTLKLKGMLDAGVQGGLQNYELTFLTDKYKESKPEHACLLQQLRDRISDQVALLEQGLEVHKVHTNQVELHNHLVERYRTVYKQYGAIHSEDSSPESEREISRVQLRKKIEGHERGKMESETINKRNSDTSSGNDSIASSSRMKMHSAINWPRFNYSKTMNSIRKKHKVHCQSTSSKTIYCPKSITRSNTSSSIVGGIFNFSPFSNTKDKREEVAENGSTNSPITNTTRKKQKKSKDDEFLSLATNYFKKPESDTDIIAKGWAMKLNRLIPLQRRFAEKIINDVLFEAEMETLTRDGVVFISPTPNTHSMSPAYSNIPSVESGSSQSLPIFSPCTLPSLSPTVSIPSPVNNPRPMDSNTTVVSTPFNQPTQEESFETESECTGAETGMRLATYLRDFSSF